MNGIFSDYKLYAALNRRHPGRVRRSEFIRWFWAWSASLKPGRGTIADQQVWIVFGAEAFLRKVLRPGMRVFEYGAGGSSLYFLKNGCELVSVEHHRDWYEQVREQVARKDFPNWTGLLREPDRQLWVENGDLSIPGSYISEFPDYAGRSFSEYARSIDPFNDSSFDVVLVDGRARVSCIHHAREKVKPGGWLILDNSERERYRRAFELLDPSRWDKHEFFGPGPYVKHEFWGTTIWQRRKAAQ